LALQTRDANKKFRATNFKKTNINKTKSKLKWTIASPLMNIDMIMVQRWKFLWATDQVDTFQKNLLSQSRNLNYTSKIRSPKVINGAKATVNLETVQLCGRTNLHAVLKLFWPIKAKDSKENTRNVWSETQLRSNLGSTSVDSKSTRDVLMKTFTEVEHLTQHLHSSPFLLWSFLWWSDHKIRLSLKKILKIHPRYGVGVININEY